MSSDSLVFVLDDDAAVRDAVCAQVRALGLRPVPAAEADEFFRQLRDAPGWKLFSDPAQFDAWFYYRGRLANGDVVDMATGEPFVDGTQPTAPQRFSNHRWRKLHLRLTALDEAAFRQPVADYVRRTWDARHAADQRVARLDFYCLRLPVHRRGQPDGFVRQNLAMIVVDPSQGNFADALRELEE